MVMTEVVSRSMQGLLGLWRELRLLHISIVGGGVHTKVFMVKIFSRENEG